MKRKIEAMHERFGVKPLRKCKECNNFFRGEYRGKVYKKCLVYGLNNSVATDWVGKNDACGMFNEVHRGRDIFDVIKQSKKVREAETQLKGQIGIFDKGE